MPNEKKGSSPHEPRRPLLAGGELLREKAQRSPGGRGPKNPHEATAFERLRPQAEALVSQVMTLPPTLRGEHIVVEAVLYPNFLANSHYPKETVKNHNLYLVGQRGTQAPYRTAKSYEPEAATKSLLLAGSPNDIAQFAQAVISGPGNSGLKWKEVARFHKLGLPNLEQVLRLKGRKVEIGQHITWEAVLTPIGRNASERSRWREDAFRKLKQLVSNAGGAVDEAFRREVDEVTYVPLWLDLAGAQEIAQFNLLRALRPMPKVRPLPRPMMRALFSEEITPGTALEPLSDHRVALFDGGFAQSCVALTRFAKQIDLTSETPHEDYVAHGSMVTSAMLYGNLLSSRNLPRPIAWVDHFRVLPVPPPSSGESAFDHDSVWLADMIAGSLIKTRHAIASISIGPDECVSDDDVPHYWTARLDQVARDYGIQFVTAAGNNGEDDSTSGMNRVLVPSDMANGLSVGACDIPETQQGKKFKRAPYSPLGPGRDGQRIAPFGVQFGGTRHGPMFGGIDHRGQFHQDIGTSYATPLVARGLVELVGSLEPTRWSAATARVFAAHFAQRVNGQKTLEVGHGLLPQSYARFWECAPNECTVLYQDDISRGALVGMMVPFPQELDDKEPIEVSWTVAFTAAVDPTSPVEYTLDGLELTYRPNERLRRITDPVSHSLIAELDIFRDRDQLEKLGERTSFEISDVPVAYSKRRQRGRVESKLRDAGKWGTLLHEEVPPQPAMAFYKPCLALNYLRRESGQLVTHDVAPLRITMLVTLRARPGVVVYDLVEKQFDKLSPLVNQLRISGAA